VVVLRALLSRPSKIFRAADSGDAFGGRDEVLKYKDIARFARPIQVNGSGGIVVAPDGHLRPVISCAVEGHKITKMEVIADPERLRRLNLAVFPDGLHRSGRADRSEVPKKKACPG
jgi:hypothetical protein